MVIDYKLVFRNRRHKRQQITLLLEIGAIIDDSGDEQRRSGSKCHRK